MNLVGLLKIYNQYLNVSSYLPLNGGTYIKLPVELQHPMKGLINIQNYNNKCFFMVSCKTFNFS